MGFQTEQRIPVPKRSRSTADLPDTQPPNDAERTCPPENDAAFDDGPPEEQAHLNDGNPEFILISSAQEPLPDTPKPKKRGRKKKHDTTNDAPKPSAMAATVGLESTMPAKRKRGRPKKADARKPNATAPRVTEPAVGTDSPSEVPGGPTDRDGSSAAPQEAETGNVTPKKRGRKKKTQDTRASIHQPEEDVAPSKVLGEVDHNAVSFHELFSTDDGSASSKLAESSTSTDSDSKTINKFRKDTSKEIAKDGTKIGNSPAAGKVPLRVGLSKRSRIAPLLKSLRK